MMNRLALLPLTALLLAACGGGSVDVTPVTAAPVVNIRGTVVGNTSGATTIEALADDTKPKSAGNPALSSATLNANGSFTLPLPGVAALTPYLSAPGTAADGIYTETGCTGSLTNSAPAARAYSLSLLTAGTQTYSTLKVSSNPAARTFTFDSSLWIYTTLASTLGGSLSCTQPAASGGTDTVTVSANAPFTAGWNVLNLHGDGTGSADGRSSTFAFSLTTGADQATTWTAAPTQASALSLDPLAASMKASLRKFSFGPVRF